MPMEYAICRHADCRFRPDAGDCARPGCLIYVSALTKAKRQLRVLGVTLRYSATWDEYRVSFAAHPSEASACYTNDLDDALASGLDMAHRRDQMVGRTLGVI